MSAATASATSPRPSARAIRRKSAARITGSSRWLAAIATTVQPEILELVADDRVGALPRLVAVDALREAVEIDGNLLADVREVRDRPLVRRADLDLVLADEALEPRPVEQLLEAILDRARGRRGHDQARVLLRRERVPFDGRVRHGREQLERPMPVEEAVPEHVPPGAQARVAGRLAAAGAVVEQRLEHGDDLEPAIDDLAEQPGAARHRVVEEEVVAAVAGRHRKGLEVVGLHRQHLRRPEPESLAEVGGVGLVVEALEVQGVGDDVRRERDRSRPQPAVARMPFGEVGELARRRVGRPARAADDADGIAELLRPHAVGRPGVDEPKTLSEDVVDVPVAEPVRRPCAAMPQGEPEDRDRHLEAVVLLVPDRADQREVDVGDRQSRDRDRRPRRVPGRGRAAAGERIRSAARRRTTPSAAPARGPGSGIATTR